MESILEFNAILQAVENTDALYVDFPYDVQEIYGVKGQVKVKVTYDGVPYRGSMVKMGSDCHMLLVKIEIRQKIGKNPGDVVHVTVQRDTEARLVDIPEDLEVLLEAHPDLRAFFDKLSFTNRKEYAVWIASAKRPETRQNRLEKTLEKLKAGKKNPTAP
ncbi:MAG: YdeI/OmpD-associated family protein [Bacteroidetes bacterium]|nr:YdeI/OmpD-associated family protein [Bacteroidota bacterium]